MLKSLLLFVIIYTNDATAPPEDLPRPTTLEANH